MENNKIKYEFNNNKLLLPNSDNILCPEKLEITFNDVTDFEKQYNNSYLQMKANGIIIFSLPIKFLTELEKYEKIDNTVNIFIPFNLFSDNINLKISQLIPYSFEITNINYESCFLVFNICYENDNLNNVTHHLSTTNLLITDQSKQDESILYYELTYRENLIKLSNQCIKGYFIELENFDEFMDARIEINGINTNDYFDININYVKISNNLFYLPINNTNYKNKIFNNFINTNRIDSLKIILTFTKPQTNIKIHRYTVNIVCFDNNVINYITTPYICIDEIKCDIYGITQSYLNFDRPYTIELSGHY